MNKHAILGMWAMGLMALAGCGGVPDQGTAGEKLVPVPVQSGDPANGAVFATDVSFWETPLSQAEMDCFWDSGVRHVVVGTQEEAITREQLAMAVSRGMTVDAYVYLYWDTDMTAQVKRAFQRVSGFPIGRMWLDIEQDPGSLGATAVGSRIQQAVTACQAQGGVECGIYTGKGFWQSSAGDTTAFNNLPLWWAHYDGKTSLSTWQSDAFGGWTSPVAKQWASKPLCGIGGVDWDSMQVDATPTVTVDRSTPPDSGSLPPAPTGLWPADGAQLTDDYAKVMSGLVPLATTYDIAVERYSGSSWITYYTWKNPNAFVKFFPSRPNSLYRFRVRAHNAHGAGAWSDWSVFEFGSYSGTWPSTTPPPPATDAGAPPPPASDAGAPPPPASDAGAPPPPASDAGAPPPPAQDAGTPPPPPPAGVPGSLAPDGNALLSTPAVKLSCSAVSGATSYEFAIEYAASSGFTPYYTYSGSTPVAHVLPADPRSRLSLARARQGRRRVRRLVELRDVLVPVARTHRVRCIGVALVLVLPGSRVVSCPRPGAGVPGPGLGRGRLQQQRSRERSACEHVRRSARDPRKPGLPGRRRPISPTSRSLTTRPRSGSRSRAVSKAAVRSDASRRSW